MAFFFLLFYVIVLLIRPQEWYEPLEGLQLVNIAAITTIFTTFITKRPGEPLQRVLSRDQFAKFMWAFLGVIIFSDLTKVRLRYAIDALSEFGKISVLFFLTMILVDTPQRARRLMWMIVWCAGIMCIHGYLQIETGEGFGHIKPYGSFEEGEFRIIGSGLFSDPNDFALLFIVSTAFVFSLLRLQGGFSKVALIVILGAMLFCLYYTQSRGGVAGFCAMLTATVWIVGRKKGVRLIVSAILLAAVVALGSSTSL